MRDAPCGRSDCPIVDPGDIDRRTLLTQTLEAGTEWFRVPRTVHGTQPFAPAGSGSGRFSPLDDRGHSYIAAHRSASLLESALHEASGPNPRMYVATLQAYSLHRLRLNEQVRLVDLRDGALARLGLVRPQLTGAGGLHYPCTRRVAERIVGSKSSCGFVWTSRQGALHADRNPDGLASEVLRHDSLDVAVLYSPDAATVIEVIESEPLVSGTGPSRFVLELANLLRIAIL
ncbi:hypothetical protein [Ilumatobacter sp.]|uniref:hypothetical protein n=1 Tax=Ilumatobacter sp. TaxID=1967498 RepID=UPI0037528F93